MTTLTGLHYLIGERAQIADSTKFTNSSIFSQCTEIMEKACLDLVRGIIEIYEKGNGKPIIIPILDEEINKQTYSVMVIIPENHSPIMDSPNEEISSKLSIFIISSAQRKF